MTIVRTKKNALRYHKAKVVPLDSVTFLVQQASYIDYSPIEQLHNLFA